MNGLFLKRAIPGLFFVYFRLFKQTLQFLQQINVKNVHPVYGAGIRTHELRNISVNYHFWYNTKSKVLHQRARLLHGPL